MKRIILVLITLFIGYFSNAQKEEKQETHEALIFMKNSLAKDSSVKEKMSLQEFVMTYFEVRNDSLYSKFPFLYEFHRSEIKNTMTVCIYHCEKCKILPVNKSDLIKVKEEKLEINGEPHIIVEITM